MKKLIGLSILTCLLYSAEPALAKCNIAVGGPGANSSTLQALSDSIDQNLNTHKNINANVYGVASLSEAMMLDSDYMVYLKGNVYTVRMQLRGLSTGGVLFEEYYSSSLGFTKAIQHMTQDLESELLANASVAERCKRK